MKKILFVLAAIAVVMAGCGRSAGAHNHDTHSHAEGVECLGGHDHEHPAVDDHHTHDDGARQSGEHDSHEGHSHTPVVGGHEEMPGEIIFPAAQAARTDFEVQTVSLGEFHEVITTSGQIVPASGDETTVVAPMPGVVSFADKGLAEGKQVSGSTRLFYISSKNMASGDMLARDAAIYRKAKADFERAGRLIPDGIVSQSEYETAKAAFEEARAAYEALSANVSDKGVAVSSATAGYVTLLSVSEGDYVEAGQTLAVVSQNRRLVLRAEVSQRYASRLANIRSANFTTPDGMLWQLDRMDGRLMSVGRNMTSGTALIPVTFGFDNDGRVLPGSYVEVKLLGAAEPDALTVPITALSEQHGLYYVYVRLDEEGYLRREVMPGADDGARIKILSGLEPGEQVVTRGAVNLRMAAASGAIPHGHEH